MGVQGRAEVDRVQAADGGRPDGLGEGADGRVQADQVDLVEHGRQAGDCMGCIPGQRAEGFDFR